MTLWHWLIGVAAVVGLVAALFGLDRLCLWLEERGWLYYKKKKPSSSAASAFVAMHQFIEPSVKHIVEVQQHRGVEERQGAKERLLASLLACLDTVPANLEQIRANLSAADRAGIDWRMLYEDALQIQKRYRPELAERLPTPESVAPVE